MRKPIQAAGIAVKWGTAPNGERVAGISFVDAKGNPVAMVILGRVDRDLLVERLADPAAPA
jgi:hypothetical protein